MIVSAHQPGYFPWPGLLHKMACCEKWVVFDDVACESSGYENRNQILTATGPQWLTVPVRRDRETKIKDVTICQDQPWRRKHFRSLELAYGKSRGWPEHVEFLRDLYAHDWTRLVDLNGHVLSYLMSWFDVWPSIVRLSSLGLTSEKSQLVLDAVKAVGGTSYIFGAKGRDYADLDGFAAAGVAVSFQKYDAVEYPQGREGFTPNLSALDLMMNVDRGTAREVMLAGGELIEAAA